MLSKPISSGEVSLFVAAMFFGLAAPLVDFIDFPPLLIALARVAISTATIFVILFFSRVLDGRPSHQNGNVHPRPRPCAYLKLKSKHDVAMVFRQSVLMVFHFVCFILSIKFSGAVLATIVFFVSLQLCAVFKDRRCVNRKSLLCTAISLAGVFVYAYKQNEITSFSVFTFVGFVLGFISAVTYLLRMNYVKQIEKKYEGNKSIILLYEQLFTSGGIVCLCIVLWNLSAIIDLEIVKSLVSISSGLELPELIALVGLGVFATAFSNVFYYNGVENVSPSAVSVIMTFELPVGALIIQALLLSNLLVGGFVSFPQSWTLWTLQHVIGLSAIVVAAVCDSVTYKQVKCFFNRRIRLIKDRFGKRAL